jgi:hypothetical protein
MNDAEEIKLEAGDEERKTIVAYALEERCLDDHGMRTVPRPTLSRPLPPHNDCFDLMISSA